jgi:predicted CoA-substrate-specific enzyme activase
MSGPDDDRPESTQQQTSPSYVGINIGAVSVKGVSLRRGSVHSRVINHQGRPQEALDRILAEPEFAGDRYLGISGHLGHISEAAALQRALDERGEEFDAVASLGGESFLVYFLAHNQVLSVLSHNKCAAGSGEFFIQQIGRMGLDMEEAIERSRGGKVVPLASRCSVHCKSDITHKLNRQEASIEDILHTLHDSMADKVVSLLEKGGRELKRVLLIGGVSRNHALVAALARKLPETQIVVLPESPYFEAWGAALLTRDEPRYQTPNLSIKPSLRRLPSLQSYAGRVRLIPAPPRPEAGARPLVLGVDAGSTTTKAVLTDPRTRAVVASYYGRTNGDPVTATKECLKALTDQMGNRAVCLVGTTGSAREIVGAFLGTGHVYNEISAQAAGAAHFDPEVDTIFEIGGQDSKYIHLQNGVPVDYAMNAACSAGTGSFLEESAKGDLGIPLDELADVALAAKSPVQFKATCAAFINSDVRIALQEGCSREDIAAGLVYSIAENYLTKVKGSRFVGSRVFLQGGVALNRALGHAFAHSLDREIVVPPRPELLGAEGVALLALERAQDIREKESDLVSLGLPEMKRVGHFTCKACTLFCTIDRFEVAGRRFPFGGRCSLFESVWKRKARTVAAPDLVEERAELIFGRSHAAGRRGPRIGIPRALTTHTLFTLYSTFLEQLGIDAVLSEVDSGGDLKAYSGFCFPAQIAHGAVLDLVRKGVTRVFLPHVVHMPNPQGSKDSYLCPITQSAPYVLAQAFPGIQFLSPLLDFSAGYDSSNGLVEMATRELGTSRETAEQAFHAAVAAQLETERSMRELGAQALARAIGSGAPAILLVGRSYNAFTPEASQSVGKKLSSMGVLTIPADCLEQAGGGPTSWHFPNMVLNAVELVKQHPNLFLLYLSNFSCTIDAFTQSHLASGLGAKPYLILEIDAHTADGGIQTRLEAFLDIVQNYRLGRVGPSLPFAPARLGGAGIVTSSSGEQVRLSDPRVKIYFPTFSDYHARACAMAARWMGLHPGPDLKLDRSQLERGLRHTSGRECLPLPICVGQLLQIHAHQKAGEIAGMYMIQGGAPCVAESYMGYFERFIEQHRLSDLFVFSPGEGNDFCGVGFPTLSKDLLPAVAVADILVEIEQTLRVLAGPESVDGLRTRANRFFAQATSRDEFDARLPAFIEALAVLPRTRELATCARVVVIGDFFTRFSGFFMDGVQELYAAQGIILKPADLDDFMRYVIYDDMAATAHHWGLEPGARATAEACLRMFEPEGREYLRRWWQYNKVTRSVEGYRRQFERTGLLVAASNDASVLYREASRVVSPAIFGEIIPTVGKGLEAEHEGFDGVLLLGPFNCLPYRISEALLKPFCYQSGMPILSYESDGYAVSPSFLRQVDVHIHQVLKHWQTRQPVVAGKE